jgi:hypothetical protein
MCGCLIILLGAVFPRTAIVLLELFTNWNDEAFDSFWIGFVGFLFLPFTTLAYILMYHWGDPINGFGWFVVVLAFFVDLSSYFGTATQRRRQLA